MSLTKSRRTGIFRATIIVLSLCYFGPHVAVAADASSGIKVWLERMATASTELSYKGRFVYNRDGETSLMEVVHVVRGNRSRERIISLSGEDQELIRDQEGNVYLMNLGPPLLIDKGARDVPLAVRINENLGRLLENYYFELEKMDRVAGHKSQVILIKPVDNNRYSYRLWVDAETGFLMRSELRNETGDVIEHIMFSDIELMTKPTEEMLEAVLYDKKLVAANESVFDGQLANVDNDQDLWDISGSPLGFWRAQSQGNVYLSAKKPVIYLMVTDGLASISIYIEPLKSAENTLKGVSRSGALSAYGRVVDKHQITVVGEVPPFTVKRIGDAVFRTTMSQR